METTHKRLIPNPRDKANILSLLTFWWTIDLFKKGYKKTLDINDLFSPIKADFSESLGDRLERKWKKELNSPGRPSLIKAILKTFWREYSVLTFITIINEFFIRLGTPILLGKLLLYFRKDSTMTRQEALYCAGGIVGLTFLSVLTVNQFIMDSFHLGMKVRVAMCSLIYRKSVRLSRTALGDTAPGKVVNLLSNDVNRFDLVTIFLNSMWSAPLMTIIVGYLLWMEAGWAGMVGTVIVFIVVPVQSYTGKLSSRFRLRTALRTDERVRFMDEVISGVQVIKMYAWEKPFAKLIQIARKLELQIVRKSSYVRGLYMTFMLFTTRMAIFCTMMTLVLLDRKITASSIFVILAYFAIITQLMSQMFVRGVAEIAEVLVALKRLQKFLEYSEKETESIELSYDKIKKEEANGNVKENHNGNKSNMPSNVAVQFKNATAKWKIVETNVNDSKKKSKENDKKAEAEKCEKETPITLDNLSIDFKKGQLIGIVGHVGAGKSSLLHAILRELPLDSGTLQIHGKLSYAGQEPWVFAGSVQQNIIFGQEFNKHRYEDIVKCCALLTDFEQFPYGDKSLIGDRGASLSGGQKARINLARAVYRKAETYLFDDPLSAVDAHVGRHLFDSVIGPKGRLAKLRATRILVTHQVHFLKEADWIIVLKDGKIEFQGTPYDMSKSDIDLGGLIDVSEITDNVFDDSYKDIKRSNSTSARSTHSSQFSVASSLNDLDGEIFHEEFQEKEKEIDVPVMQLEQTSKGQVTGSVFLKYFQSGANFFVIFLIFLLFLLTQVAASLSDFWVSFWVSQEELRDYYKSDKYNNSFARLLLNETVDSDTVKELTPETELLDTYTCMYIHATLVISLFIIAITRSLGFYTMSVRASQKLHDGMFKGIVSATMRFFDTNPSGRILNRFSKDMGSVDELLPKAILDASQLLLSMFGAIVVTIVINPYLLIPLSFIGCVFIFLRRVYLKTSKNIKRIEGITRSPVFSHLATTLTGLSTIRAFDAQGILIQEFDGHQDLHSGAWYMFITASTAFGFTLDLLCLTFIFLVTFSFLLFASNDVLGDEVGLAITQSLSITGMMQWGVRQSAEVANFMMSVERLLEYCEITAETQPIVPREVGKNWPTEGKLEFKNVIYRYYDEAEPVLKNLSFKVNPNEKIGIVGRTGAGKSSLIGAIFRMAKIEGQIFIDNVDTSTITLQDLRSRISIIPQDPVLFSGTLRRNLDPFEEYPDSAIWTALEEVELKDLAGGALGLQTSVLAGGSNFSVGQRQLLCLARAILRNNKLLVLDEATANVDPQTDNLIQHTIRERFAECTVLTVAHRLHTIIDSDRVIVMSAGNAVEFDAPYTLLQNPTSIFKEMVDTTGPAEAERLFKLAKEKFESTKKEN